VVSAGEQCDCGDGQGPLPDGCAAPNSNSTYGGCTTRCTWGPYCGDGIVQDSRNSAGGNEECDLGKDNGISDRGRDGCTLGCTVPHYCGDGIVDTNLGEECDLGADNGKIEKPCDGTCHHVLL